MRRDDRFGIIVGQQNPCVLDAVVHFGQRHNSVCLRRLIGSHVFSERKDCPCNALFAPIAIVGLQDQSPRQIVHIDQDAGFLSEKTGFQYHRQGGYACLLEY